MKKNYVWTEGGSSWVCTHRTTRTKVFNPFDPTVEGGPTYGQITEQRITIAMQGSSCLRIVSDEWSTVLATKSQIPLGNGVRWQGRSAFFKGSSTIEDPGSETEFRSA